MLDAIHGSGQGAVRSDGDNDVWQLNGGRFRKAIGVSVGHAAQVHDPDLMLLR